MASCTIPIGACLLNGLVSAGREKLNFGLTLFFTQNCLKPWMSDASLLLQRKSWSTFARFVGELCV